MEAKNLIAKAEIVINAATDRVWEALVDPAIIKKYMFGTTVESDWTEGSQIIWKGEWKGKQYEDKGEILSIQPNQQLQYSHFSPLTGQEDKPENYHTVTIDLSRDGNQTKVTLTQDNNQTEKGLEESEKNWNSMLQSLKSVVEN